MTATEILTTDDGTKVLRLLDEVPEILAVLDSSAHLIWANRRAEEHFGRGVGESLGMSALDIVHPDDLELALLSLETVQQKDEGNPIEIRVQVDGEWRLMEVIGRPVGWFCDGAILFSLRDLTHRRRFEVAGNDDARFRSLHHNATSIVLLVSDTGLVESASGALTRVLGHDPELVELHPLRDLVAEADRPAIDRALEAARRGATASCPITVGVNLLHRDAAEVTEFELSIVNLIDDPTVAGFVVAAHDVSARVAAERELIGTLSELREAHSLLSATLDSTANGILVVSSSRRITSYNRQFLDMWQLSEESLAGRDDIGALAAVVEQLTDPIGFLSRVDELYARPSTESSDTIHFKDGRVFERLSKPQFLAGEVVGRVWSFMDVTDQKRLEHELAHMAFHDHLTGLANRALFRDRLEQAIARSARTGKLAAVLFLDVDDFKTINDSVGHSAGDLLLLKVAERLGTCVRATDTAARLGGDEFAVLVEDVEEPGDVTRLAERILSTLREPLDIASHHLAVSVSVGITYSTSAASCDELLSNADLAMYTAKVNGKDRIVEYQPQMHTAVLARLDLEVDLRRAIVAREFEVHYQPIVDLRDGTIRGFEALARWRHPSRGLLAPSEFIEFAEDLGLIGALDHQILEQACADVRSWQASGIATPDLLLSVNLSAGEIIDPRIASIVTQALGDSSFEPVNLVLEITERVVMEDVDAAIRNLTALRALGVRIAIDDFGTGYSSLSHLERLPVDILKIDRSFLTGLGTDSATELAHVIVQLSDSLGVIPIAEGVESATQAAHLRTMGCHLAQGYFIGRPKPAEATRELLADEASGLART